MKDKRRFAKIITDCKFGDSFSLGGKTYTVDTLLKIKGIGKDIPVALVPLDE